MNNSDIISMSSGFTCGKNIKLEEPPIIIKELCDFLQDKGHNCMRIIGLNNHIFEWCQKDECPSSKMRTKMNTINEERMAFVEELKLQGHKCVKILESFPVQVRWCEHIPCLYV